MKSLYIIVPCYNEQEVLPETVQRLVDKISMLIKNKIISFQSRILFVDDGSSDNTWDLLCRFYIKNDYISIIKLSRNVGHQKALFAGLMASNDCCDFSITIDADLQDDIEAIDEMIIKFDNGCDIVYGVRKKRDSDSVFKKMSAQCFYKVLKMLGADIIYNHADFRLMSKRAMDALSKYKETNIFLRGMIPLLGYPSDIVYYDRASRFAGNSKYPLKKMIAFALDGITSFSIKPLRLISRVGILISFSSIIWLIYALVSKIFYPQTTVSGWTAIMVSIWFIGGVLMLCMGILGEYIGKIFSESKSRPIYHIEQCLSKVTNKDES